MTTLAGAAHDVFHHLGNGKDEQASADWIAQEMQNGFTSEEIEIVRLVILATTTQPDSELGLRQAVVTMDFPDARSETIARLVACADLEALCAPYSLAASHNYLRELGDWKLREFPIDLRGFAQFEDQQVALLERYRYPHPTGEKLLGLLRGQVIDAHKQLAWLLHEGFMTTWEELEQFDALSCTQLERVRATL